MSIFAIGFPGADPFPGVPATAGAKSQRGGSYVQTQPVRTVGVVYKNNTNRMLYVTLTSTSTGSTQIFSDNINPPTTVIGNASVSSGAADNNIISFVVPPGNYYKCNNSFIIWTETY